MSLDRFDIQVSILDPDGPPVQNDEICARLALPATHEYEIRRSEEEWDVLGFAWPGCTFAGGAEEADEFDRARLALSLRVAAWIAERAETLRALTADGAYETTCLLTLAVSQSQFDFVLPVELVEACGRARMKLLVTGDSSD